MKVAIVNRHIEDRTGGSELQCDLLASGLQERGHEVIYIVPGGKNRDYESGYKVIPCRPSGRDIAGSTLAARPDVLYWRYNKIELYSSLKKIKKGGIPVIFAASHKDDVSKWSVDRNLSLRKQFKSLRVNRWNYLGMRYVDALTVNNRNFLGKTGVAVERYIPNGMSISRTHFEWPRPFLVWVSNIKKRKRPELFLKLAGDLGSSDVDFLMVGNIQQSGFEWLEKRNALPDNFYYLGPKSLEETCGVVAASEFLVHTCLPEGFPNVFIQAWLSGKPVVNFGTDPSGYIEAEELGFCAEEDWDRFVTCTKRLIAAPDLKKRMGGNARSFARSTFSLETFVENVEELMKQLVGGGNEKS